MDFTRFLTIVRDARVTGRPAAAVKVFEDAGLGVTHLSDPMDIEHFYVNTTPHPVRVLGRDGRVALAVPAATDPLRLEEKTEVVGYLDGIPVVEKRLEGVGENARHELALHDLLGFFYIVPLVVAQAVRYYRFLVPDDLVRDEEGKVVGCRRFSTFDKIVV